jgi:hypothetical protein
VARANAEAPPDQSLAPPYLGLPGGRTPDGWTPDGQPPDGQPPDGQPPDGQAEDGHARDGRETDLAGWAAAGELDRQTGPGPGWRAGARTGKAGTGTAPDPGTAGVDEAGGGQDHPGRAGPRAGAGQDQDVPDQGSPGRGYPGRDQPDPRDAGPDEPTLATADGGASDRGDGSDDAQADEDPGPARRGDAGRPRGDEA